MIKGADFLVDGASAIARRLNVSDLVIGLTVRRLLPIIAKERKKHEKRKELLSDISNHFAEGEKLLSKAEELIGVDDLVVDKLRTAMSVYENAFDEIANFIDRGRMIEKFQFE